MYSFVKCTILATYFYIIPLVKSTHVCQQGISKAGILQSSNCEEQHVLRPFSRESSGAVTDTTQTLKYVSESQSRSSHFVFVQKYNISHVFIC
jgi:hypothetical protein